MGYSSPSVAGQVVVALKKEHIAFFQVDVSTTKFDLKATGSSLPITHAARRYFNVWFGERLVADLLGIVFPLPLHILVVGVVIVLFVCSHLGSFYWQVVVSFLYFNSFHYYYCYYYFILDYFDRFPPNVFQCDWCPSLCCVILFCLPFCWGGGT